MPVGLAGSDALYRTRHETKVPKPFPVLAKQYDGDLGMAVDGNWNITMSTPMGERNATLSLKAAGGTLTGVQGAEGNPPEIFAGTANGDDVAWKVSITNPMPLTLEFTGKVAGDSISGEMGIGPMGSFPFTGTRAQPRAFAQAHRPFGPAAPACACDPFRPRRHTRARPAYPSSRRTARHHADRRKRIDRLAALVVGGPFDLRDALRLTPRRDQLDHFAFQVQD